MGRGVRECLTCRGMSVTRALREQVKQCSEGLLDIQVEHVLYSTLL
jgi:hypothetical protein